VNVHLPDDGEDLPPVINTHRMKPIDIPIEEEDEDDLDRYNTGAHYHVHCAGGYRSVIATSLLKHHGFYNLTNVYGVMGVIKNTIMSLVQPVVAV
jgi:rhodanese-related sulfurtransferase